MPGTDLDITVSDVTLAQFEAIAMREGLALPGTENTTSMDLARVPQCMASLAQVIQVRCNQSQIQTLTPLMQLFATPMGLTLELAYPLENADTDQPRKTPNLNLWVNAVLRVIYAKPSTSTAFAPRRRITFTSLSPRICCALNWKQPNCASFTTVSSQLLIWNL